MGFPNKETPALHTRPDSQRLDRIDRPLSGLLLVTKIQPNWKTGAFPLIAARLARPRRTMSALNHHDSRSETESIHDFDIAYTFDCYNAIGSVRAMSQLHDNGMGQIKE